MTEHKEQVKFVQWCKQSSILCFAIPNGSQRNRLTGYKLKLEGVKPGVPDMFIPIPFNGFSGLFIEMKNINGGKISPDQLKWLKRLNKAGYMAIVCNGFEDARNKTNEYLGKSK